MNSVIEIRSLGRMARSPASEGWYSYKAEAVATEGAAVEETYAGGGSAGDGVGAKKLFCFSFKGAPAS